MTRPPRAALAAAIAALAIMTARTVLAADGDERTPAERAAVAAKLAELRRKMDADVARNIGLAVEAQASGADRDDALLVAGAFLELGVFGEADKVAAAEYFRLAAEKGLAEGYCSLAAIYASGAASPGGTVPRDDARALTYYEKAAAGGSVKAMLDLGVYYADGLGGGPDAKKALMYFMEAARRGDETALERLGPVMEKAKEWEAARPGRKAEFPTSREELVDPALVRKAEARNARLERLANAMYQQVTKRIVDANRDVLARPGE